MSPRKRRRRARKLLFDAALSLGLLATSPSWLPIVVNYVAEPLGDVTATYVTQVMLGTQP